MPRHKKRGKILIIKTLFLGRRYPYAKDALPASPRTYCLRHGFTTFPTISYPPFTVNAFTIIFSDFLKFYSHVTNPSLSMYTFGEMPRI